MKVQSTGPSSYIKIPSQLVIAGYVTSAHDSFPNEALRLQDLIVVSFLMLEKTKRAHDNSVTNMINTQAHPLIPSFGVSA